MKQNMSKKFIALNITKIDWYTIIKNSNLKLDFVYAFSSIINWTGASRYIYLSEIVLKEFEEKIDWNIISEYRLISEDILFKFKDKINFELLSKNKIQNKQYKYYSKEFILKMKPLFNDKYIYHSHANKLQKFISKKLCLFCVDFETETTIINK